MNKYRICLVKGHNRIVRTIILKHPTLKRETETLAFNSQGFENRSNYTWHFGEGLIRSPLPCDDVELDLNFSSLTKGVPETVSVFKLL